MVLAMEYAPGPIPAWAGEPSGWRSLLPCAGAYPRMGGGTGKIKVRKELVQGLSPHGRGNPCLPARRACCQGPIPAWAGEPEAWNRALAGPGAYPRMGGGTITRYRKLDDGGGLSPHGRGNLHRPKCPPGCRRPIPAWAGEPWARPSTASTVRAYPRMGGGTVVLAGTAAELMGLSPHGRGNRLQCKSGGHRRGPIPAWAGEPSMIRCSSTTCGAYPRMGGGTQAIRAQGFDPQGLSPHGRGNRMHSWPIWWI